MEIIILFFVYVIIVYVMPFTIIYIFKIRPKLKNDEHLQEQNNKFETLLENDVDLPDS